MKGCIIIISICCSYLEMERW